MSRKVILTGGGTGGHIFPAISIANALRKADPSMEVLFVGANGGMEMTVVPQYGYTIQGVTISGIARSFSLQSILKNLAFPFKLWKSMRDSAGIIAAFKPDAVVGVGGYASGPVGRVAARKGIPLVLCEQNAYPGITNKWLAPKAARILLGNEAAAQYFADYKAKLKVTGNPVRETLLTGTREAGLQLLGLRPDRPVVLSLGGSLGAGTLNAALEKGLQAFIEHDIQLVWQCGKRYHADLAARLPKHPNVHLMPFIQDMANAYAAADLVLSRAGGSTISELILLNKPSVLVPSPNVAEDHQTKNAKSLVDRGAARLVKDVDAPERLATTAIELLAHPEQLAALRAGIASVEKHDSANEIAHEILALMP
jgi:UDP-N-acetylglucosamine--N-acetylmuramyl-(pentapeptide) pyrophosphoryl-undecaprenol N-acetylglucosamine transferase